MQNTTLCMCTWREVRNFAWHRFQTKFLTNSGISLVLWCEISYLCEILTSAKYLTSSGILRDMSTKITDLCENSDWAYSSISAEVETAFLLITPVTTSGNCDSIAPATE